VTTPYTSRLGVTYSSYALAALLCLCALLFGLLPGLLATCVGYLSVAALQRGLALERVRVGSSRVARRWGLGPKTAATLVIALPLVGLVVFAFNAKHLTMSAIDQYRALLDHLATTVLQIREKLPADLAAHLPDEPLAVQTWLAGYLKAQASALTNFGKLWLQGSLLVYVGLVVGALIGGAAHSPTTAPLRFDLRQRALTFTHSFRQIMVGQFWIALFNAACTAIFLLAVLPFFGAQLPYTPALIALTFVAGLIPIAGNLLCNGVLALVGVSVSPVVGLACLGFLIAIHKFEYFIAAKVVGSKTNTAAWELLAAMFIGEAIFGVIGLVAAPLYYAYLKKELSDLGFV
jgi:predicted PurR-regulated permease PerM